VIKPIVRLPSFQVEQFFPRSSASRLEPALPTRSLTCGDCGAFLRPHQGASTAGNRSRRWPTFNVLIVDVHAWRQASGGMLTYHEADHR
jgi:hypothetical protein